MPTGLAAHAALGGGENSDLFLRTRVLLATGDRMPSADLRDPALAKGPRQCLPAVAVPVGKTDTLR